MFLGVLKIVLISDDDDDDVQENPHLGSVPSSNPPPSTKQNYTYLLQIIHVHASNDNHIL